MAIEEEITCDSGCAANDVGSSLAAAWMGSVYYCPNWLVTPTYAITNTPSNTYMRAPGIFLHLKHILVISFIFRKDLLIR